jgi:hypothetical protein
LFAGWLAASRTVMMARYPDTAICGEREHNDS